MTNFSSFLTPKKRKERGKKRICGRPSGHNFGHPLDRKHFFFKGGLSSVDLKVNQGPHCTGKTGKITKIIPCQGKHREYVNFAKTQGILFTPSCKSLILKVKNIAILAAIALMFFLSWKHLASQFYACNSHKPCKLAQGKFDI